MDGVNDGGKSGCNVILKRSSTFGNGVEPCVDGLKVRNGASYVEGRVGPIGDVTVEQSL